jgi:hypothetical protein
MNCRSMLLLSALLILSAGSAHAQDASKLQFGRSKIYQMQTQPAQEETSIRTQTMVQNQQRQAAMNSNIAKKQSQTSDGIVSNIK